MLNATHTAEGIHLALYNLVDASLKCIPVPFVFNDPATNGMNYFLPAEKKLALQMSSMWASMATTRKPSIYLIYRYTYILKHLYMYHRTHPFINIDKCIYINIYIYIFPYYQTI